MTVRFKSQYNEWEAFTARGDLLREHFGHWDALDPVAHAILDLAEAQNEIANLFMDDAEYGTGTQAAFTTAVKSVA